MFTADDVNDHKEELILMLKQSFKSSFPKQEFTINSFAKRIESLKRYLKESKAILYGCEKNGVLIGFIWFFVKDNNTIHINHFVVEEHSRGLGVGTMLWKQVEDYAIKEKLNDIELLVTKDNESAIDFYNKRKFEIERFVMKKRLFND